MELLLSENFCFLCLFIVPSSFFGGLPEKLAGIFIEPLIQVFSFFASFDRAQPV
jgi:hypothetical protein